MERIPGLRGGKNEFTVETHSALSYSSRTSFLGYVRRKDYHYVGRIDSFRFSPSSPGVGHIVEEKSTSSMRHRWCSRLYVTCIRTVGAYPTRASQ